MIVHSEQDGGTEGDGQSDCAVGGVCHVMSHFKFSYFVYNEEALMNK